MSDRKTNWERLSSKDVTDTVRYRDVYEQQQLDRRGAAHMQSPVPRTVAAVSLSVIVTVITWFLIAGIQWLIYAARVHASYIIPSSYGRLPFEASFVSFIAPDWLKVLVSLGIGLSVFAVLQSLFMRNLRAQNALADTSDINEYMNDQHIALPEEVQRKFDYFPDAGAHCSVSVSSMISHIALENKGIKRVEMVEPQVDEDDDREFYDILAGDTSDLKLVKRPLIDEKFQDAIFETSGVPKKLRRAYDARRIPYNKGNVNRNKLKGYDTVADMINGDWEMPLYEPQRPGGAYLVDTDPVNTMVLAITRAGKGQTIIEPTIDMWLREKKANNIVVNDPKGELLVQFYVPAAVRGFQPVQLNLINAMKTDIYNPLIMAAQSAREGDSTKCAAYVENIADVFFPQTEGEDPVWSNSANNAFKRAAYGLIDFFLEEEVKMRGRAARGNVAPATLENEVDTLWGRVTLYNCYQLFVQLTSRKRKNPYLKWQQKAKDAGGTYNAQNEAEERQIQLDQKLGELVWNGEKELDELTLFFNATSRLPRNSIRTLVANADNALRAMGGADKMIASVYGIALTAMSFFADPTISTLTSGTPSQNIDLAGLSFPRRIGVQFHQDFMRRYHLVGLQCRWQAYSDPEFKESLGEDFYHQDSIGREGWARMYFKGIFPDNVAYLKLEIRNASTGGIVKRFFFKFTKSYQVSLDGRYYVTDPVLDEKIIKNGVLEELVERKREDGSVEYVSGKRAFNHKQLVFDENAVDADEDGMAARPQPIPVITSNYVRYSEKPKIVFMITPPHLAKYAKLLLIIIKELTNLNFEQSYMTKSNQKPLYLTRFMLDELGNLQSEGHGISNFETMLSIGLGQGQQFHCILQTLAQLTSVYGDSVDSIVQGNAQPLSSKIATPTGWHTMGDISVGDEVLTPKGKISQVTGVYPKGVRKVYRVTTKDGRSCLVCGEHLWKVRVK